MVKVRGSKDGKIIKASFKGQSKSLFPTLKQTKALVLLSTNGNEFCTGEYLKAIIHEAISTHNFTTFLVADEIYWHNLCHEFSNVEEKNLRQKAKKIGENFLEKNFNNFLIEISINPDEFNEKHIEKNFRQKVNIINELSRKKFNFEIAYWDDWLNKSPSFCEKKEAIMKLYKTEKFLANSIELTAENFAKRHQSYQEPIELLCKRSEGYLIEECSAIIWIGASLGYNFIVYPGEMIKPFKTTKEFFVKNTDEPCQNDLQIQSESPHFLVNWLEVCFQRRHEKVDNKYQDMVSQLNLEKINDKSTELEISAIMKGITEGIFSLKLDDETKIDLLVDFLIKYKEKNDRFSYTNNKSSQSNYTDQQIKAIRATSKKQDLSECIEN